MTDDDPHRFRGCEFAEQFGSHADMLGSGYASCCGVGPITYDTEVDAFVPRDAGWISPAAATEREQAAEQRGRAAALNEFAALHDMVLRDPADVPELDPELVAQWRAAWHIGYQQGLTEQLEVTHTETARRTRTRTRNLQQAQAYLAERRRIRGEDS